MANTKQIDIEGIVPFDLNDHKGLEQKLACLNKPAIGIRITYPKQAASVPNNHGGLTAMYHFNLTGVEAVAIAWLQSFVDEVKEIGGSISHANVYDMDAQDRITLKL